MHGTSTPKALLIEMISLPPLSSLTHVTPLVSFILTWVVLGALIRTWSHRILDHPNRRSLHHRPVPRLGGIAVAFGIATGVPFVSQAEWWPLWFGALLLVVISFVDDIMGLPIVGRLVTHLVTASGFVFFALLSRTNGLSIIMIVMTIVAIVWMINLYNFMDGMDGLAGGMAVFGFGFLAIAASISGNSPLALINASIVGAAAAFLFFNFHPAQVFLGDAGSTAFGFLAAGISLIGWRAEVWSLWVPILVFAPFIVDATLTLFKRILRGEKFWQAHRSHCYQRLVLSGWGQRRTVMAEYVLMILCGIAALAYQRLPEPYRVVLLVTCAALFALLITAVDRVQIEPSKKPS
jgi:UDP-GlcNAc:undecaprenyl-phosphate/decaprenyl-phosphate GlcNAc-1-phosphate transferase